MVVVALSFVFVLLDHSLSTYSTVYLVPILYLEVVYKKIDFLSTWNQGLMFYKYNVEHILRHWQAVRGQTAYWGLRYRTLKFHFFSRKATIIPVFSSGHISLNSGLNSSNRGALESWNQGLFKYAIKIRMIFPPWGSKMHLKTDKLQWAQLYDYGH